MNLRTLVEAYQTDKVSTYQKLRYHVRENHRTLLRRLVESKGDVELSAIRARDIKLWHMEWSCDGQKLSIAHAFIAQLRTISGYGLTMMEEPECERLCLVLHKLRFAHPQPRTERLTAAQAIAIRAKAHEMGLPSIALAQAFQFELMLRQKCVIGEFVPFSEPGDSDVRFRGQKWLRGLTWAEIDDDLILHHMTSKRQKMVDADLRLCPMIMEELSHVERIPYGPVVLYEKTGMPWTAAEFRRKWRKVATAAGVPKAVRNMDSRSGGITESFEAGVAPVSVQLTATHSDLAMTQKYHRSNHLETRSEAQIRRVEFRKKDVA